MISVGGATWSGAFSGLVSTEASRLTFAQSCVTFIKRWGFDGVDIDWEFPVQGGSGPHSPDDLTNFTLLLQKLRELLDIEGAADNKQYLLSIASSANNNYYPNYEWTKIHEYLDFINMMTYDFHGTWEQVTGFLAPTYIGSDDPVKTDYNANLAVSNAVTLLVAEGVPEAKIVMGVPFYGIGWGGVGSTNNGLYQPATGKSSSGTWENGHYDYSDLLANYEIASSGFTKFTHDECQVPYLYNPTTGTWITYEDPASIEKKMTWLTS